MKPSCVAVLALALSLSALSCGNDPPSCNPVALAISPATTSVSHTPPGNQVQFTATEQTPPGCRGVPLPVIGATWSVSDPVNVTITNSGLATCVAATNGEVTVTATSGSLTGTARLTCF